MKKLTKKQKIRDFDFYLIENILFFIALPIAVQLMLRHGNTSLQKKKNEENFLSFRENNY